MAEGTTLATKPHIGEVRSAIRRAMANGAQATGATPTSWKVDYAGDCEMPFIRQVMARPSPDSGRWVTIAPGRPNSLYLEVHMRCRQCISCLKARSGHWSARARVETERSRRTWFGTLTLTPEAQHHYLSIARREAQAQAEDLDAGTPGEIFAARVAAIGPEIGLFLKRIRKNSQAQIRYLCVAEEHKSGDPHFHMLIHEYGDTPVLQSVLIAAWKLGFSHFKLVASTDTRVVYYVTKYLAKSINARVRASLGYGAEGTERNTTDTTVKRTKTIALQSVTTDPHMSATENSSASCVTELEEGTDDG